MSLGMEGESSSIINSSRWPQSLVEHVEYWLIVCIKSYRILGKHKGYNGSFKENTEGVDIYSNGKLYNVSS